MAKHNIQATSTICGATGHSWLPSLAANYRQCASCRSVEMLIDGQWVSPTGRGKRSSPVSDVSAPTWLQEAVVDERDLQARMTPLVDLRHPIAAPSAEAAHVQGGMVALGEVKENTLRVDASVPHAGLDEVRTRFLAAAERARHPVLRFQVGDDLIVYTLPAGGEEAYQKRAMDATLLWLWNAVGALEQVSCLVKEG